MWWRGHAVEQRLCCPQDFGRIVIGNTGFTTHRHDFLLVPAL